ncbi:MAG TPA: hypothetical protein VF230_11775 [Acidimicrobiales bacterium]
MTQPTDRTVDEPKADEPDAGAPKADEQGRLDRLQDRIDEGRQDLAELAGTDDEPRFSDDGRIEDGAGTDTNAPPG